MFQKWTAHSHTTDNINLIASAATIDEMHTLFKYISYFLPDATIPESVVNNQDHGRKVISLNFTVRDKDKVLILMDLCYKHDIKFEVGLGGSY